MKKLLTAGLLTLGVTLSLAACSGSSDDTATPTATAGSPTASSPSATVSSPSPSDGSTTAAAAGGGGTPTCATSDLRLSVRAATGGGAAGSTFSDIVLRNAGDSTCAMTGWPGVSYVTGDGGRQVGAAAVRQGTPAVIRLAAGQSATARLQTARAENFENCRSTSVRGYRIYPPNQRDAVFVSAPTRACAGSAAKQLTIRPVQLAG